MVRFRQILGCFALAAMLVGCAKSPEAKNEKKPTPPDPKSKEAAVAVLREFYKLADGKEYEKAAALFIENPDFDPKKAGEQIPRMLERKEISLKGIDILVEKGEFLQMTDPSKGDANLARKITERLKDVKPEDVYGLGVKERGGAMFVWDGTTLKILRLSDIGRLDEERPKSDPNPKGKGPPPKGKDFKKKEGDAPKGKE